MLGIRLYIQCSERRLRVSSPQRAASFECEPLIALEDRPGRARVLAIGADARALEGRAGTRVVNPFAHPRIVIDDFAAAESLLKSAIRPLTKGRWWSSVALGILHPERDFDGGLTDIERRALYELCIGAGCRQCLIHRGAALSLEAVMRYASPGRSRP
ncbi:rod shape-determining protein [Thiorhodococcus minor]|uniref:Rod shape-determining protein MreB n=1 Tax=Thiorhodococcus minor TaxID=57489 RepID=A0A6M0K6A1_9GAMM|nr:rod shape-determining protein [Thiorhodococcus minor]NEV64969.1 rod shape-determining protein MreB [Thiorhodococcus minor]